MENNDKKEYTPLYREDKGKLPPIEDFRRACIESGSVKTQLANYFGVAYNTIDNWLKAPDNEEYRKALEDGKKAVYDESKLTARLLARGLPLYGEDEHGRRVFAGWQVPPSERMVLLFLHNYGDEFDKDRESKVNISGGGIPVSDWVKRQIAESKKKKEAEIEEE